MQKEMVLYYCAEQEEDKEEKDREKNIRMMKSVLVRMGVRIKNIRTDQVMEKIGYLAGIEGYNPNCFDKDKRDDEENECVEEVVPVIRQDVLVMKNFTSSRIDALLLGLRKAGVPRIALKAVVTPQNEQWSFYRLYKELVKEDEEMRQKQGGKIKG